jgi:hypothetical protein
MFEVSRYLDNYVTATTWFCSPTIDNGYFEITGCPIGEAPPDNVDTKLSVLTKFLLPAIQSLSTAIRNQPNFDATCGTSSISAIAILTSLENQLCIASQTLVGITVDSHIRSFSSLEPALKFTNFVEGFSRLVGLW